MPPTLDPQLKEYVDEIKSSIGTLQQKQQELAGKLGEHDVNEVAEALKSLEQKQQELAEDVTKRLQAISRVVGGGSRHYRGAFASEDDARAFGLAVIGKVLGQGWATEALKSDHKDVYDLIGAKAFTTTNADAVIPEQWVSTMVNLLENYGVFEPAAMSMPMSTDTLNYSKKTARIGAQPMDEGSSLSSANPTLAAQTLTAKKWGAYTEVNNEVSEDAIIAVAEMIMDDMAESHAKAVDDAGFNGDGTASYNSVTGILNALHSNQIQQSATGNTTWDDLTLNDHEVAVSLLATKAFSDNALAWYCSTQYYWRVMVRLMLSQGGVTAGEIEGRRRPLFMGYPVVFTAILPSSSAAGQISAVIGNLRQGAKFGDRRQLRMRASEHFKFSEDATAMLSTRRYAINIDGAGEDEVMAAVQTAAS